MRHAVILKGSPMRGHCQCGVDLDKLAADGYLGHACGMDPVSQRIRSGQLPATLQDADWTKYAGPGRIARDYDGFCRMWNSIAWVRYQAFERDADAEWAAEDYQ